MFHVCLTAEHQNGDVSIMGSKQTTDIRMGLKQTIDIRLESHMDILVVRLSPKPFVCPCNNEHKFILRLILNDKLIPMCRIIFSAHTHKFCDHTHSDGTREITVPAMSWAARDDPAFVVATFRRNGRAVTLSHCTLARESHVLFASISVLVVLILSLLVTNTITSNKFRKLMI